MRNGYEIALVVSQLVGGIDYRGVPSVGVKRGSASRGRYAPRVKRGALSTKI